MTSCECEEPHVRRRIVLTGGPGAGKTAVLALVRQSFCRHVVVLPEAASILFGGGLPRAATARGREAVQRAIFHVQRAVEDLAEEEPPAVVLCDRGTPDGFAYWPEPREDFWAALGTTRAGELARYDAVIHLRVPSLGHGYDHSNPVRTESAEEAAAIDGRIAAAWAGHPRLLVVESAPDFLEKAQASIALLRAELPACCRGHVVPQRPAGER